jgi:hypothetical protein
MTTPVMTASIRAPRHSDDYISDDHASDDYQSARHARQIRSAASIPTQNIAELGVLNEVSQESQTPGDHAWRRAGGHPVIAEHDGTQYCQCHSGLSQIVADWSVSQEDLMVPATISAVLVIANWSVGAMLSFLESEDVAEEEHIFKIKISL